MKRLTTLFLGLLIAFSGFGQTVLLGDEQYGSELVINGDFAVSTGWTFNDDWSYDAVNLEADYTDGVQSYFDRSITITAGITYQVSYTIKNYSAGTGYIWFTNQTGSGLFSVSWWTITANGVFTANYVALESATSLRVYAHSLSVNYSIDDISIKAITKEAGYVLRAYDSQQPLNIETSCEGWYDGDDDQSFTLSGTSVDQWDDKSGNARHLINGNADATRPTYDINTGRVTFIAANSTFLQSAAFGAALSQPTTIFIAYKVTGGLMTTQYIFDGTTGDRQVFYRHAGSFKIFAGVGAIVGRAENVNDNIHVGEFNGANSNYWINGILDVTGNPGANSLNGITLGSRGDISTRFTDIELMEVIVFGDEISAFDRDKITGYLSNKWDITATTSFKGYVLYEASTGGWLTPLVKKMILGLVLGLTLLILTIGIYSFLVKLLKIITNTERSQT